MPSPILFLVMTPEQATELIMYARGILVVLVAATFASLFYNRLPRR